jgi:hypothetical protein
MQTKKYTVSKHKYQLGKPPKLLANLKLLLINNYRNIEQCRN